MLGGTRVLGKDDVPREQVRWPVVTDDERRSVLRVLDSGSFTSVGGGQGDIALLEKEWAEFVGVPHCAAVSNGTAAIELALAAAGLEPGAEVLVPALSFIASAAAPAQRGLMPVFCDVDPVSFNISPESAAAAVTARTQAIVVVHLHGLPCDMDELRALARRHELLLVEDAAQAHGARYRGRTVGALGDIATFSLNASKNLPTCGEGGLVTTASAELHEAVVLRRQFGEDMRGERSYLSTVLAGNEKLSAIQAAFTRCQLSRLASWDAARNQNVAALLARLGALPGLRVPSCPPDRTHAWHILRFRFDPAALGCPEVSPAALRTVLQRALHAEGVPLRGYQPVPLPAQPALRSQPALRGARPWRPADHPVAAAIIDDSLTLQRWHLNPAAGPVLARCADAFEKVWENMDALIPVARATASPRGRTHALV
jgi:dTDP-4-amino-4,6-dideoxygalactose transaminase